MDLPVCRLCLSCDVSHNVRDVHLRETYERLAGAKFYSVDQKPVPVTLCYYCYWQLRKFSNFAVQACSSHKILKEAIKRGAKVGLKYIQNQPKKCHLTMSTIKTLSLDGSLKRKSSTNPLKKMVKKVKGENINDYLKPLHNNTQNLKSILKNSLSSLELHLAGNPELIIKKQKKPEKFQGEIVQINTEIETEHDEREKLSPNKIQSTENNAQSDPEMIEEFLDFDYDDIYDETLYPCHESKKMFSSEKYLAENNKKPNNKQKSNLKETKIETQTCGIIKIKKKDMNGFNQSGGQVFRPVADTSLDVPNLNIVAEFLEIENDTKLRTNLIVNNKDKQDAVYQIEENVDHQDTHNNNTQGETQSIENDSVKTILELHLAGNPELIIKKQKKPEKLEGEIVQINTEIETEQNEREKLSPNKIQSTENNAQSDPEMIEEFLDFDYDRYDETLYPCHESKKIFSSEKYLAENNKKPNNKQKSNLKETKIETQTCGIIKIKKKDMNGFNHSGGQVFRPVADTSLDVPNLNIVAEFLEIENDTKLRTKLIVNNKDKQDAVYQIEENVDHQDTHNNNTQSETQSNENDSEKREMEINNASQSKKISGTINSASKHLTATAIENVTNELIYKCNFCKKVCTTKENLDKHKQAHTMSSIDTKIKRYACKECGQQFSTCTHLVEHERRHTNERPFMCEICGKSFMTRGHLGNHSFQVHSKSKHVCKLCNKSFKSKCYINNYHLNYHFNVRPFVCHVCKRAFHQSGSLWEHIRNIHQGRKLYACDICSLKCDTKPHLNRHMLTHSGIKAFTCDYCNMDFTTKSTLRRHVVLYCKMK